MNDRYELERASAVETMKTRERERERPSILLFFNKTRKFLDEILPDAEKEPAAFCNAADADCSEDASPRSAACTGKRRSAGRSQKKVAKRSQNIGS